MYSISSICSRIQRVCLPYHRFDVMVARVRLFVTVDGYEAYYGDCVATITGLDADRLGYFDIEDEITKLGYENWGRICYKHRTTREFKDITDDAGVMDCLGQMQGNKRYVEIYVQTEHLKKPCGVVVCQQENGSRNRVSEVAEVDQAKDTSEKLSYRHNCTHIDTKHNQNTKLQQEIELTSVLMQRRNRRQGLRSVFDVNILGSSPQPHSNLNILEFELELADISAQNWGDLVLVQTHTYTYSFPPLPTISGKPSRRRRVPPLPASYFCSDGIEAIPSPSSSSSVGVLFLLRQNRSRAVAIAFLLCPRPVSAPTTTVFHFTLGTHITHTHTQHAHSLKPLLVAADRDFTPAHRPSATDSHRPIPQPTPATRHCRSNIITAVNCRRIHPICFCRRVVSGTQSFSPASDDEHDLQNFRPDFSQSVEEQTRCISGEQRHVLSSWAVQGSIHGG
ncbi:phosphatidylinositol 4-phosphate 5-kinase 1 [Striga asiatica]|uniref:Phosphatidylinositol 4-phosphate 5-kinase 1 n=1 Tax=Striga asiatica TaxID=4170 RepID=A0A5A7RDL4_STRAF|nr:phosphatidylinositol 4-phosphate 5-kinase 1 [Striga asiatica]